MDRFSALNFIQVGREAGTSPFSFSYRGTANRVGPAIILLHELGGSSWSWTSLVEAMQMDWTIVAPDLPGAGMSEKPEGRYSLENLAFSVLRFKRALGISQPATFVGQAMGSVVALEIASKYPEEVAALILIDGTSEVSVQNKDYLIQRSATVAKKGMRAVVDTSFDNAFRGLVPASDSVRQQFSEYRARFLSNSIEAYARNSEALANYVIDVKRVREIAAPSLVLTGEHDFIWPPPVGRTLCSALKVGHYETIEGAAHFSAFQEPQRVAALMISFLKRRADYQ